MTAASRVLAIVPNATVGAQFVSCLSMKLSKAAETQRMSYRGFQSAVPYPRSAPCNSRLCRCDLIGFRHEQEQGIGEGTFMDKQDSFWRVAE